MAIPDKINFLQMGRYGLFSEQTFRNTFTRDEFDWFSFNLHLADKVCTGKFRAIAVDPSFIPKAGNKTPWFGKYWSGAAASMKRGLELLGIGLIDVENHDCMTLGAIQTPDAKTLEEMDYNLVDWYRELLISMKGRLQAISKLLVADAFFAKKTFIRPRLLTRSKMPSTNEMTKAEKQAWCFLQFATYFSLALYLLCDLCISGFIDNPLITNRVQVMMISVSALMSISFIVAQVVFLNKYWRIP